MGFLFIGEEEHEMHVLNLSITGLLVQIDVTDTIHSESDVFELIKGSNLIDIYIEKLNLAGEAEIVRVEMDGNTILIALEFKQITYDADSFLYKRKAYRKSMASPGEVLVDKSVYEFMTRNVSVDGLLIRIPEIVDLRMGLVIEFKFDRFHLLGDARVVWFEHDNNEGTLVGLEYQHMEKGSLKEIPQFYHRGE